MGRLIDADALIETMKKTEEAYEDAMTCPSWWTAYSVISEQHTAYDVEKTMIDGQYCWQNCCATEHCKECNRLGNGYTDYYENYDFMVEEHKGGWISVEERMPENDGEDVLVWFEYFRYGDYNGLYQRMGISYTFRGDWSGFVNGQSGWSQLRILAWQPLPTPYTEE